MIPENWRDEWQPTKKEGYTYRGKPLFWWINKSQSQNQYDDIDTFRILECLEFGDVISQCVSISVLEHIAPHNIFYVDLLHRLLSADELAVRMHARNAIFRINNFQQKKAQETGNGHLPLLKDNVNNSEKPKRTEKPKPRPPRSSRPLPKPPKKK